MALFYKPTDGWAGDFIPFHWEGRYHLFYLKDYRDEKTHGKGMSWFHISTPDFLNFEEHGEAIPHGAEDDQDLYVFTGCVCGEEGRFHIFYTGHNPLDTGRPNQAVMHATSEDLINWHKDPDMTLWADEQLYEADDWRDPFVFWNSDADEYWMLIAARLREGPKSRRGCTALATSEDLAEWEVGEPFWAPHLYHTHECPDLFRWGDWWYFVYSTFTERFVTHYRKSTSLDGPWTAPRNDTFDGRAFYAAKTAGNGTRRFAFGWNPTRAEEKDSGSWQWGGNLVVHEIIQGANGDLHVKPPPELTRALVGAAAPSPQAKIGRWEIRGDSVTAAETDRFAWCALGELPRTCMLRTRMSWGAGTRGCGLLLRADPDLGHYYQIRVEPQDRRVVFDRWPRPGDQPFVLERPVELGSDGSATVTVLLDGSVLEVYVDDFVAMSARGYDHAQGTFGLFVSEGEATFSGLEIGLE